METTDFEKAHVNAYHMEKWLHESDTMHTVNTAVEYRVLLWGRVMSLPSRLGLHSIIHHLYNSTIHQVLNSTDLSTCSILFQPKIKTTGITSGTVRQPLSTT